MTDNEKMQIRALAKRTVSDKSLDGEDIYKIESTIAIGDEIMRMIEDIYTAEWDKSPDYDEAKEVFMQAWNEEVDRIEKEDRY